MHRDFVPTPRIKYFAVRTGMYLSNTAMVYYSVSIYNQTVTLSVDTKC